MKTLRFDSVGGASGDMILGALIGLGVDADGLAREIERLRIGHFHLVVKPFASHGISGLQAAVDVHDHDHGHHDHHHHDGTDHHHGHGGSHRGWAEIRTILSSSSLPDPVKVMALGVFGRIAEVEARIHGVDVETVHFHEVGAVDSIVDIVGSCLALHRLGVEEVVVEPLPIGHGTVTCAHGVYPSPAPATLELLKGLRVVEVDEPFETVTPTGAALLARWSNAARVTPGSRVVGTSYSFGQRMLKGRPNVLRATLFESSPADAAPDACLLIECNVDDSTPQVIGATTERLMSAGALDVFTTPIQMKKQRPAVLLSVLCTQAHREAMLDILFRETTTLGVREQPVERTVLERRWEEVDTPWGRVRVKIGTWKGRDVTRSPELEDCLRLAREKGVPVRDVIAAATGSHTPST